jgi:hypothetical protein
MKLTCDDGLAGRAGARAPPRGGGGGAPAAPPPPAGRGPPRDHAGERTCLAEALRLVRGVPFADRTDDPFFGRESVRLQDAVDRLRVRQCRLALDDGDHEAAREGAELVLARDPLSQQALGVLMSALAAAGQVREALTVYQDAKDRLVEETGLDPDPGLTDLYTSILRGGACAPARPVPRQLPAFRDRPPVHPREHDRAWGVLTASGATTCPVVSVNGPGGIGKSAFAVHLAHHVEDRYPDGQLFADLHGNVPGHDPVDADRVVRRFLRALGHGGDQWQDTEDATAQFRSVTAGLRVLIVLDDVRDVAQVRPLLPGGSRCAVIVTSRHTLPSLRGAEHVALSLLDRPAARAPGGGGRGPAGAPPPARPGGGGGPPRGRGHRGGAQPRRARNPAAD